MDRVREQLGLQAPQIFTGAGVRVAVLDSGIDLTHPDFEDRIDLAASEHFTVLHCDLTDRYGHGTHIAGIIGGSGRSSEGRYRGVAPDVTLLIYKITHGLEGDGSTTARAIEAAIDAGADIINYSSGWRNTGIGDPPWIWPAEYSILEDAFKDASDRGLLCVVAAGNCGVTNKGDLAFSSITPPGGLTDVLTVGSVHADESVARSSGKGPFLRSTAIRRGGGRRFEPALDRPSVEVAKPDLVAPGEYVVAPRAAEATLFTETDLADPLHPELRYGRLSGTSQATAVVSGLAACLLEAARKNGVDLTRNPGHALHGILRLAAGFNPDSDRHEEVGFGFPRWPYIQRALADYASDDKFRQNVLHGPQLRLDSTSNVKSSKFQL